MALSAVSKKPFDSPATLNVMRGVSERANDSDLLDGFRKRQGLVFVFQKHHGTRGELTLESQTFRAVQGILNFGFVDVRVIEKSELILDRKDGQDSGVELGFCDFAVLHE